MKEKIKRVSVDEVNKIYEIETENGSIHEGLNSMRDIGVFFNYKEGCGYSEAEIWYDGGATERRKAARKFRY
jgi:hypothetical protein